MSLAKRLAERRIKMNAETISDFVENLIKTIEKIVDEDKSSLHFRIRLDFFTEDHANLIVNCKEYCTFDTTKLLGTTKEKFVNLLEVLKSEGFKDCTISYSKGGQHKTIYSMGFDI